MKKTLLTCSLLAALLCVEGVLEAQVAPSTPTKARSDFQEPPMPPAPAPKSKVVALVAEVEGTPKYLTEKIHFTLDKGSLLPPGGDFQVPAKSRVVFRPMPGITGVIFEDSSLRLMSLEATKKNGKIMKRSADVYLGNGSVFSALQKYNKQATQYQVRTPQAVAGAKGTEFMVSYRQGVGKVVVYSGVVKVTQSETKTKALGRGITPAPPKTITLSKNQAVDLEGVGQDTQFSEVRPVSPAELDLRNDISQVVSQYQAMETPGTNPFFTTTEATERKDAEVIEVPGQVAPTVDSSTTPNSSNTSSSNPSVSPTGP